MLSNRILWCLLCLALAGGSRLFDRSAVDHGSVVEKIGVGSPNILQPPKDPAEKIIAAAQKEIGIRETSENTGSRVEEYNAYAGVKKAPWCASFVSWCFAEAGYPQPRTAWSPALFPRERQVKYSTSRLGNSGFSETTRGLSRDTELIPSKKRAGAGLVIGIYFESKGRIAHCGILERIEGDWAFSIEGNTNSDGGREGDGVYVKKRHRRTIYAYANWLSRTPSTPRDNEPKNELK